MRYEFIALDCEILPCAHICICLRKETHMKMIRVWQESMSTEGGLIAVLADIKCCTKHINKFLHLILVTPQ